MKFALLGADDDSLALAAAAEAAGHEIAWIADARDSPGARGGGDRVDDPGQWEDLLDPDVAAGIIMGLGTADPAVRCQQLQELVKQGRPVLASFPLFPSVLSFFEVDMARGESGAVIRHFNPIARSGAADLAREAIAAAEHGPIEQILCERALADRCRDAVLRQFARDAELLDVIAGGLDRVGAHGAAGAGADDPRAYAGLSVQLSGRANLPVRWSVSPPHDGPAMRLTLVFAQGRTTIDLAENDQVVGMTTSAGAASNAAANSSEPSPAASLAISEFVAACETADAPPEPQSTWPQALHVMELADSIEISLRRGRMIDVQGQQLTEQLAFRGTMAAAGCALLLLLPPLLLLAGWLAGLVGIDAGRYWPHLLLGLLGAFLALQILPKLIYPQAPKS